jgi:hypothetical protein
MSSNLINYNCACKGTNKREHYKTKRTFFVSGVSSGSTFDRQVKGSANRAKNQIYLSFSEAKPAFDEVKGTNKRGEYQNYSWFSRSDGAARAIIPACLAKS